MATEPQSQKGSGQRGTTPADMPSGKRAAIDADAVAGRTLGEVTAADFLEALYAGGATVHHLAVWPEKKKVELYVDREAVGRIPIRDFIDVVKTEKKKREREPYLGIGAEGLINPTDYGDVLGRLVREVDRLNNRVAQLSGVVITDG
jgi:hypothetical protein